MWIARSTGDMTLSVLDENNKQILKVDMLKSNTMKAGTNGALLTQTLNSLYVISQFPGCRTVSTVLSELPYPEDNILPLPWLYTYKPEKRFLRVKHAKGTLCERQFPLSFSDDYIKRIVYTVESGINQINVITYPIENLKPLCASDKCF